MRHGFKAHAERLAMSEREAFGLSEVDRLNPKEFLAAQNIIVWGISDIQGLDRETGRQLTKTDPNSWSGITLREGSQIVIILNSAHGVNRHASTMMHEWSHLKLDHKPNRLDRTDKGMMFLTDYPADVEEEADWLGAAILLPREGLLHFRSKALSHVQIADHYGVGEELVRWRTGKTGIDRQLHARARRR